MSMVILPPALLSMFGALVLVGVLLAAGALGAERTGLHAGALAARWCGTLAALAVVAGFGLLGLSGATSPEPLAYGAVAALGPGVGGTVLVVSIALGERTLAAPQSRVRSASLVPRSLDVVVPAAVLWISGGALVVLVLLSVLGASLAVDGRGYATERALPTGEIAYSYFSPFPGLYFTAPLWAGMTVLSVCTVLAIREVIRRRPSNDARDILLRRRSSTSVLGAVVLSAALSILPVSGLLVARLLTADGLARTTSLEKACILLGGMALVVGFLLLPVGLIMVVFPEVFARRSPEGEGRQGPHGALRQPAGAAEVESGSTGERSS